jgi:hypothetical protein
MADALGKDPRDIWAAATALHLVDGALSASERSGGPLPNADQVALLREIAKRALWHIPNSRDEVRKLVKYLDIENLRQPHSRDDEAPDEPPWSWKTVRLAHREVDPWR